jgi:uncharacterized protein YlzI (FlbEa/FlbD family)
METNNILSEIFYDPKIGLMSFEKFRSKVKEIYPEITRKETKEFYENQEINQTAKKPVYDKSKEYKITGPELSFQIDLMFVPKSVKTKEAQIKKAKEEGLFPKKLFYVFLLCVDILSRKAYIYSLPDKTIDSVMTAYKEFLDDVEEDTLEYENSENLFERNTPFAIITDDGFNFKAFNDLNEELNILVDSSTAYNDHITQGNRLGIIDRLVRTIKNLLMKFIYATSGKQYSVRQVVKEIVENYNNTPHSSLDNVTPNQVFGSKEARIMIFNQNDIHNATIDKLVSYDIGDKVRVLTKKETFSKEKPQFSKELYTIIIRSGNKYIVEDKTNKIVNRKFKYNELQKIEKPNKIQNKNPINVDQEIRQNQKQTKNNQILKQLDIKPSNILPENEKRIRKPNSKYN